MASLPELQERMRAICEEAGWDTLSVPERCMLMMEEMGELAKAIRHYQDILKEGKQDRDNLEEELADVLAYLLDIANAFDVDLERAYTSKMDRVVERIRR